MDVLWQISEGYMTDKWKTRPIQNDSMTEAKRLTNGK